MTLYLNTVYKYVAITQRSLALFIFLRGFKQHVLLVDFQKYIWLFSFNLNHPDSQKQWHRKRQDIYWVILLMSLVLVYILVVKLPGVSPQCQHILSQDYVLGHKTSKVLAEMISRHCTAYLQSLQCPV